VRAIRAGAQRLAPPMFAGAFLCGAVFVCAKCLEYADKFADGITAATNNFYMLYFIFTWLHLFHVLVGMGLLIFMFMQARKPTLTVQQFSYVEGGACFWHMVDLLWVVLFPLIYLVRS
jgi:nitric oxide reductase NorE protein